MKAPKNSRSVALVMLSAVMSIGVVAFALQASGAAPATKPGITLQISPASQSVEGGSNATYTVTLTSTGGFAGVVALSASGLPSGSTPSFLPTTSNLGMGFTSTSVLTVATITSTPVGAYTFTVTGTSGKVSGSVTAGVTVNAPLSSRLSMTATPALVTMAPGSTAAYAIQLFRENFSGKVTLTVVGGLPAGATPTFSPNPTTGNSSTLQVTTTTNTPDGTYTLSLLASGKNAGNVTRSASASVQLAINSKGKPFTISGSLVGLAPGRMLPLQLSLANPNSQSLSVTNLSVTLSSVNLANRSTGTSAPGSCSTIDYAVTQYNGPYPLVVPGLSTKTLGQLSVPDGQLPQITLVNRPVNQDGCKGATLNLSYSGSGQGN